MFGLNLFVAVTGCCWSYVNELGKPPKKVLLLMARPLRGGGVKRPGQRSKISTAMKLKGGGGLGLNGPAIMRRTFFCGFP